jgi:hypothetical protein
VYKVLWRDRGSRPGSGMNAPTPWIFDFSFPTAPLNSHFALLTFLSLVVRSWESDFYSPLMMEVHRQHFYRVSVGFLVAIEKFLSSARIGVCDAAWVGSIHEGVNVNHVS